MPAQELPASAQPNLDPGSLAKTGHHDNDEKGKRAHWRSHLQEEQIRPTLPASSFIIAAAPVLAAATFFGIRHFTRTRNPPKSPPSPSCPSRSTARTPTPTTSQKTLTINSLPSAEVQGDTGQFRAPLQRQRPRSAQGGERARCRRGDGGRLTQRGESLSITWSLWTFATTRHSGARNTNAGWRTSLRTQRDIASEIARKLQLRLSGEAERAITKRYTNNNEAYQAYLKGATSTSSGAPRICGARSSTTARRSG